VFFQGKNEEERGDRELQGITHNVSTTITPTSFQQATRKNTRMMFYPPLHPGRRGRVHRDDRLLEEMMKFFHGRKIVQRDETKEIG
jgi:hypothetical protein